MNLNLFIAKKLRGRGLSSTSNLIACVSVAISIAVMLAAVAIANGFRKEVGRRTVGFTGEILLTVPGMDYVNDVYPLDAALSYLPDIMAVKEVKSVHQVLYKPGMLKTDTQVHGLLFKGVDSTAALDFFAGALQEGQLPNFSGPRPSNQVLVSARLARLMGLETGGSMTVYFMGEQVRARKFVVSGLYDMQLEDLDERLAIVDLRHLRRINGWEEDECSCVEISLGGDGGKASGAIRSRVYDEIGRIIMEKDTYEDDSVAVVSVDEIYPGIFDWLALLDLNVLVVLALMVAVCGFNMISSLLIILFERISMIGLLKSLGMHTSSICKVFVIKGSEIVLKGMVWGNLVALSMLFLQSHFHLFRLNPANYFVNYLPVDLNPLNILLVNVAAFVLMLVIMLIPSVFISKVSPDRTLRME